MKNFFYYLFFPITFPLSFLYKKLCRFLIARNFDKNIRECEEAISLYKKSKQESYKGIEDPSTFDVTLAASYEMRILHFTKQREDLKKYKKIVLG